MKTVVPILVVLALSGCSSGGGSPTEPPPPEEPLGAMLDLSAVAGTWTGWDYSADYAFDVEVRTEARVGESAGEFNVLERSLAGKLRDFCTHDIKAKSANPPTFMFDARDPAGKCTPTTITFVYNSEQDRIEVTNSIGDSGFLVRGDDRGPPPQ